jgi:hypothetical protein
MARSLLEQRMFDWLDETPSRDQLKMITELFAINQALSHTSERLRARFGEAYGRA